MFCPSIEVAKADSWVGCRRERATTCSCSDLVKVLHYSSGSALSKDRITDLEGHDLITLFYERIQICHRRYGAQFQQ